MIKLCLKMSLFNSKKSSRKEKVVILEIFYLNDKNLKTKGITLKKVFKK